MPLALLIKLFFMRSREWHMHLIKMTCGQSFLRSVATELFFPTMTDAPSEPIPTRFFPSRSHERKTLFTTMVKVAASACVISLIHKKSRYHCLKSKVISYFSSKENAFSG